MDFELLFSKTKKSSRVATKKTSDFYPAIWELIPEWIEAAEQDLKSKFDHNLIVRRVELTMEEFAHRQGAHGVIFHLGSPADPEFLVRLEFLIDHPWFQLTVSHRPANANSELEEIANIIEKSPN